MPRRIVIVLWMSLVAAATAGAQPYVEAGATIGRVCLQGEASCADQVAARGWQAGLWLNEMTALRLRHLDAPRPDLFFPQGAGDERWTSRRRSLWLGEMTWHLGAPRVVRLYAGFSLGVQRDDLIVECQPTACGVLRASGHPTGRFKSRPHLSPGGTIGVSIHPTRRLMIMAGFAAHDFLAEHWSVSGLMLHVAYRHPLRR